MNTFRSARIAGRVKAGLLLLGGLAGVMAVGAAGAAAPDSDVPTVVVKFSGQNLATPEGVSHLYRRIVSAAKQVCPDSTLRDLDALRQTEQCRDDAIARAIRQIDNPQLAALYASRSKNG